MNEMLVLFLQIMLINVVLSGDNAVVIAMASQKLEQRQRKKAIWWGAFGAIGLRLVLTLIAVQMLGIPYIQAIGSILLLYIAIRLLADNREDRRVKQASSLGEAIRTVIVADFIMSLDNVLAIAAVAEGETLLIIIGIGLSIPLIIWGSTLIMHLLDRFPVLVYIGAALLGYTAGEMIVSDSEVGPMIAAISEKLRQIVPLFGAIVVILAGLITPYLFRRVPGE